MTLPISPAIIPVIVIVLRSARLFVVTQYGDGNCQNNSNYSSEHVLSFAIASQTTFQLSGQSTGQQGITETTVVNKIVLFDNLTWFLHKKKIISIVFKLLLKAANKRFIQVLEG